MQSLALLTDLYQLTMAQGYYHSGLHQQRAVFHLFFRKLPFSNGYAIAAGLDDALRYLETLSFTVDDIAYLATLRGADDAPLFTQEFLGWLKGLRFTGHVDAIAEGEPVFAHEPLLRIEAPLCEAQLIETALLNIINFQTLIATKAARIVEIAGDDPVLEFGLRRAQGIDGALSASRAAYIGGVTATSNALAGKNYGIPVRGTHAHAWVMAFADELSSFSAYAKVMPNNCVFLVDTYDTLQGVRHAIEVGKKLQASGHRLLGIRLDSGDLAYLSQQARHLLDEAGFADARIVASNDLDEHLMASLKQQGARIDTWGIGTKLVTGHDQPALGGVYKLAAIREHDGAPWQYKVKISEQAIKTSNPGILQVRRYGTADHLVADAIFDVAQAPARGTVIVDPLDHLRRRPVADDVPFVDLLQPVLRDGKRRAPAPTLTTVRAESLKQRKRLHPTIRRLVNPHGYPVGLDLQLFELKNRMVLERKAHS